MEFGETISIAKLTDLKRIESVCSGTFHVLRQSLPCAGVLDAVSAPGRVKLDQPGRGGVGDRLLQGAAAQDHQRVLLRVQPDWASRRSAGEPKDGRCLEPQPKHPRCPGWDTPRAGGHKTGEFLSKTRRCCWGDMSAAARSFFLMWRQRGNKRWEEWCLTSKQFSGTD